MRTEKSVVGNYAHVYNRGIRKMAIFNNEDDYWRFIMILRYFNNKKNSAKALQELSWLKKNNQCQLFGWPQKWPAQEPLADIVAYCLMPNHFHLILREIQKNGIAIFMQKLGTGYTNYFNSKYEETGRLFQGPYKAKIISDEDYLQYVDAYVQVFNPFELFHGGIDAAHHNFDKAFRFALDYQFCSLGESFGKRNLSIIKRGATSNRFSSLTIYKKFAQDALLAKKFDPSPLDPI